MAEETNVAKVRIGLGLICVVVVAAIAMMIVIESPAGKAVMFAIAVTALVRFYLLYRSLRREQRPAD
ncbi:MAG TPA: hypothetical protein VFI47_01195 [Acidimicrobiales bacterium]|nr:hypothetical protein [Acidimicrobiales bacterium]